VRLNYRENQKGLYLQGKTSSLYAINAHTGNVNLLCGCTQLVILLFNDWPFDLEEVEEASSISMHKPSYSSRPIEIKPVVIVVIVIVWRWWIGVRAHCDQIVHVFQFICTLTQSRHFFSFNEVSATIMRDSDTHTTTHNKSVGRNRQQDTNKR
jgi:hypothetical protein